MSKQYGQNAQGLELHPQQQQQLYQQQVLHPQSQQQHAPQSQLYGGHQMGAPQGILTMGGPAGTLQAQGIVDPSGIHSENAAYVASKQLYQGGATQGYPNAMRTDDTASSGIEEQSRLSQYQGPQSAVNNQQAYQQQILQQQLAAQQQLQQQQFNHQQQQHHQFGSQPSHGIQQSPQHTHHSHPLQGFQNAASTASQGIPFQQNPNAPVGFAQSGIQPIATNSVQTYQLGPHQQHASGQQQPQQVQAHVGQGGPQLIHQAHHQMMGQQQNSQQFQLQQQLQQQMAAQAQHQQVPLQQFQQQTPQAPYVQSHQQLTQAGGLPQQSLYVSQQSQGHLPQLQQQNSHQQHQVLSQASQAQQFNHQQLNQQVPTNQQQQTQNQYYQQQVPQQHLQPQQIQGLPQLIGGLPQQQQQLHQIPQQAFHPHQQIAAQQQLQQNQQPVQQQQYPVQQLHQQQVSEPLKVDHEQPSVTAKQQERPSSKNPSPRKTQSTVNESVKEESKNPTHFEDSKMTEANLAPPAGSHVHQPTNEESGSKQDINGGTAEAEPAEPVKRGHLAFIDANIYQAATLNKLLPPGFRIEVEEIVKRAYEQKLLAQKKAQQNQQKKKKPAPPVMSKTPDPLAKINAMRHQQIPNVPTNLAGQPIGVMSDSRVHKDPHSTHLADINEGHKVGQASIPVQQQVLATQPIQQVPLQGHGALQQLPQPVKQLSGQLGNLGTPQQPALTSTPSSGPRKSNRDVRVVNYNQMAAGIEDVNQDKDYGDFKGQTGRTMTKKASVNQGSSTIGSGGPAPMKQASAGSQEEQALVRNTREVMDLIFDGLKNHPAAGLFTGTIDVMDARVAMIKKEVGAFFNLNLILRKYENNEFKSTFQLLKEMRTMWMIWQKYYSNDPQKLDDIKNIQQYFDTLFTQNNMDNKPLVVSQTSPPSPLPQANESGVKLQRQQSNQSGAQQQKGQTAPAKGKKQADIINQQLPSSRQAAGVPPQSQQTQAQIAAQNLSKANRSQNQLDNNIREAQSIPRDDRPMNLDEKNQLKMNIGLLNTDQQRGIILLVKECIQYKEGDVFEFELDQLPAYICRQLDYYVKKCYKDNLKKEKRKKSDQLRRQQQRMQAQQKGSTGGQQQSQSQQQAYQQATNQPASTASQAYLPQQIDQGAQPSQQFMMGQMQQNPALQQQFGAAQGLPQMINPHQQQLIGQLPQQQQLGHQGMQMGQLQSVPQQAFQQQQTGQMLQPGQQLGMHVQQPMQMHTQAPNQAPQLAPVMNQNFAMNRRGAAGKDSDSSSSESDSSSSDESDSDHDMKKKHHHGHSKAQGGNLNMWKKQ